MGLTSWPQCSRATASPHRQFRARSCRTRSSSTATRSRCRPRSRCSTPRRASAREIVFDPMVAPERWRTLETIRHTADRLNQAADLATTFGLSVGYHNHSFEFHHSIDGVSGYEYFVSLLDPRVVLELDVFWAAVANQDVAALVGRLDGRVRALHLKDGFPGVRSVRIGSVLRGIDARPVPTRRRCDRHRGDPRSDTVV